MSVATESPRLPLADHPGPSGAPGLLERLAAARRLALAAEERRPLPAEALRVLGIEPEPAGD